MASTKNYLVHAQPSTLTVKSYTFKDCTMAELHAVADFEKNLSDGDTQGLNGGLNEKTFGGSFVTRDPQVSVSSVLAVGDTWTGDGTGTTFKIIWTKKKTAGVTLTALMPITHDGRITDIRQTASGMISEWTVDFISEANAAAVTADGFTITAA